MGLEVIKPFLDLIAMGLEDIIHAIIKNNWDGIRI